MAGIFRRIALGEIPSYKIAEDKYFYAFLDINPMAKGHTLVIPKEEVDYLFDIDDELLKNMIVFSKRVAKALKEAIPCERVGMMVVGMEVPHAHIHLIPISQEKDMNLSNARLKLDKSEFKNIAKKITEKFI